MTWEAAGRRLAPLGILLISLFAGLIFQKLISVKLRKVAQKSPFKWENVLTQSMKGLVFVWFLLAGIAIALKKIPLSVETIRLFHKLISITAIFSGILFFVRLSAGLISLSIDKMSSLPTTIIKNITVIIVYLLGFLIILDYLGISITPLITALGVGGLAVALALQDTLSNLFSGVYILVTKKIRIGDYIKLESGEEGIVTDITWRNSTIKALSKSGAFISKKGGIKPCPGPRIT